MTRTRSALTLALGLALLAVHPGCRHTPTEKEKTLATIQYDLAVQAMHEGKTQQALTELEKSLALDPYSSRAQALMGILLHNAWDKPREAIPYYERALELDPHYSEARVNLGNVYLDLKEYDKAVELYEQALNDMKYATPHLAHTNLGMAEQERGNHEKAIAHYKSAITMSPKFCLAYRNLGALYEEEGKTEASCQQYGKYREMCPDAAEAYYREALCLAKQGDTETAHQRFVECEAKAEAGVLKDDCRRLGAQLE